jgi:hypothetical protein
MGPPVSISSPFLSFPLPLHPFPSASSAVVQDTASAYRHVGLCLRLPPCLLPHRTLPMPPSATVGAQNTAGVRGRSRRGKRYTRHVLSSTWKKRGATMGVSRRGWRGAWPWGRSDARPRGKKRDAAARPAVRTRPHRIFPLRLAAMLQRAEGGEECRNRRRWDRALLVTSGGATGGGAPEHRGREDRAADGGGAERG